MSKSVHRDELVELCTEALLRAGADPRAARVLADATVEADLIGNRAVGVAHLFDYLDAYRSGRIARDPSLSYAAPHQPVIDVDARDGLAQVAFAEAFEGLLQQATRQAGIAALWIRTPSPAVSSATTRVASPRQGLSRWRRRTALR